MDVAGLKARFVTGVCVARGCVHVAVCAHRGVDVRDGAQGSFVNGVFVRYGALLQAPSDVFALTTYMAVLEVLLQGSCLAPAEKELYICNGTTLGPCMSFPAPTAEAQ